MIQVPLTRTEVIAHELAGNAADSEVANILYLVLTARGMNSSDAQYSSETFASAALEARRKIKEATAYQIVVTE